MTTLGSNYNVSPPHNIQFGLVMLLPGNRWPNTPGSQSTLFFAQLMQELLHDRSWDSYRAYALDMAGRIKEFRQVYAEIRAEKVGAKTIDAVLDELIWALKSDQIAKLCCDFDIDSFCRRELERSKPLIELVRSVNFLEKKLLPYRRTCEDRIVHCLANGGSKIELRRLTKLYCSHLLNIGYHRQYVYGKVVDTFFERDMGRVTTALVQSFFRHFDGKRSKYLVVVKVLSDFANALKTVSNFEIHDDETSFDANYVAQHPDFFTLRPRWKYASLGYMEVTDEWSARSFAEFILNSHRSILFLIPHRIRSQWDASIFVAKVRGNHSATLNSPSSPMLRKASLKTSAVLDDLERISSTVLSSKFDQASRSRLLVSLNTAALAANTPNPQNQLISLWSAFEALLPEPDKGEVRITHFEKLITPVIVYDYLKRMLNAFVFDMRKAYGKEFSDIVSTEVIDGTEARKLLAIATLAGREAQQRALLALCTGNPLALNRLGYIQTTMSRVKSVVDVTENHFKRVSWQLQRIYRHRNAIVHAGREDDIIDTLIVNLDDYFRSFATTVISYVSTETVPNKIDQTISNVGTEFRLHMERVKELGKGDAAVSDQNFATIFSRI